MVVSNRKWDLNAPTPSRKGRGGGGRKFYRYEAERMSYTSATAQYN